MKFPAGNRQGPTKGGGGRFRNFRNFCPRSLVRHRLVAVHVLRRVRFLHGNRYLFEQSGRFGFL